MTEKLVMDTTAASIETGADAVMEDRDRGRSSAATGRRVDKKAIVLGAAGAVGTLLLYSTFATSPKKIETAEDKRATTLAVQGAMQPAPDSTAASANSARIESRVTSTTGLMPPQTDGTANGLVVPSIKDDPGAPGHEQAGQQSGAHGPSTRDEERMMRLEAARKRVEMAQARQAAMMHADVMVLNESKKPSAAGAYQNAAMSDHPSSGSQTDLSQQLKSTQIQRVEAGTVRDRAFVIEAGRQMPCILQNALDSTLPGLVSCIIPENVRGANGQVVLLDKGTRVIGEYRGGMQQGQSRIFVIWTRAITPAGVSIMLGSPGADALGRAGLGGKTETFFWKRFGGALLISMVGDASTFVGSRIGGVSQVVSSPNSAAAAAVENDIRIKPVLRAKQGQEMTIFAANDFDFSNVYSLRLKR